MVLVLLGLGTSSIDIGLGEKVLLTSLESTNCCYDAVCYVGGHNVVPLTDSVETYRRRLQDASSTVTVHFRVLLMFV